MSDAVKLAREYVANAEAGESDRWPGMAHIAKPSDYADAFVDGGCPMSLVEFEQIRDWRERIEGDVDTLARAVIAQSEKLKRIELKLAEMLPQLAKEEAERAALRKALGEALDMADAWSGDGAHVATAARITELRRLLP